MKLIECMTYINTTLNPVAIHLKFNKIPNMNVIHSQFCRVKNTEFIFKIFQYKL